MKNIVSLVILSLMWGPSFYFIKISLISFSPFTISLLRVLLATVILWLLVVKEFHKAIKSKKNLIHFGVMGLFANALPFVLISWGEKNVSSAMAAVLNGIVPIFTFILAIVLFKTEKINLLSLLGLLLGLTGLLLLVLPKVDFVGNSMLGVIAICTAAMCYAFAIVYSKKYLTKLPLFVAPVGQLAFACLWLLPITFFFENPIEQIQNAKIKPIISLLSLSILGTAIAFALYYKLLEKTSASFVSYVTYLMPIIGIIIGVVFLKERFDYVALISTAIILAGVYSLRLSSKEKRVKQISNYQ